MAARATNTPTTRRMPAWLAVMLAVWLSGCGDAAVLCGSSTSTDVAFVGCTGDPGDDGLTLGVAQEGQQ